MASNRLKMSLLPALQAILDTGSVTRAADQMHVTQSTMSRTLSQLREALNDPILVREGNHIFLSEKARQVQPLVSKLMADSETLFENQHFDPAVSEHHFRIGSGAVILDNFLIQALIELKKVAPGISSSVSLPDVDTIYSMESGELDLGIIVTLPDTTANLCKEVISTASFNVLMRKGHPMSHRETLDLTEMDQYPFVITQAVIAASPYINSLREQYGFLRNPWLKLPSLQAALQAIRTNDAFTIVTNVEYLAMDLYEDFVLLPTLTDSPPLKFEMVWPEHWQFNQAHQWMRGFMLNRLQDFFRQHEA
ncbi:LysR family transcriptional regulator [Endozoicomonas arenosclerae]|uniref:LysR family transcriptional regulator n=1 Tax=Endozoicomonas arenosclerae TaxID=1633495 RepID=UPI000781D790|nr:LysR family transcriptional regulator [Endozoicomonas arenosclerae]